MKLRPTDGRVRETGCLQTAPNWVSLDTGGAKIGNAHLEWAFSEAAVCFLQKTPPAHALINRLRSRHGKVKALSILAAKLGRATYFMLKKNQAFDMDRFLRN